MTKKEQGKLLSEWQNRLYLTEWRIKLNMDCRPEDMRLEHASGCTEWSEPIKTARIDILDEKYYGSRIVPFDFEKTLVHELLHLKFCLFGESRNDVQDRLLHQYIDEMSRALVGAKRMAASTHESKT